MPLPGEATVENTSCAFARAGVKSMPVPGWLRLSTGAPGLWTIVSGESTISCWLDPLPLADVTVRSSWLAPVSIAIWSPTAKPVRLETRSVVGPGGPWTLLFQGPMPYGPDTKAAGHAVKAKGLRRECRRAAKALRRTRPLVAMGPIYDLIESP